MSLLSDRQITYLTKGFVALLLLFVVLGAVFTFRQGGLSAVPEMVVSLYVVSLVAYGVFRGGIQTKRFRVALYVGVVAWALVNYLDGMHDAVTIALLVIGALLLTRELTFAD